jgi:hypothetical protein
VARLDYLEGLYRDWNNGGTAGGGAAKRIDAEFARIRRELGDLSGVVASPTRLRTMLQHLTKTLHPGVLNDCFYQSATAICRKRAKTLGRPFHWDPRSSGAGVGEYAGQQRCGSLLLDAGGEGCHQGIHQFFRRYYRNPEPAALDIPTANCTTTGQRPARAQASSRMAYRVTCWVGDSCEPPPQQINKPRGDGTIVQVPDKIAIVGVACRFPGGVADLDSLWSLLSDGREAVGAPPPDRFDLERYHDPNQMRPGKSYTFDGGYLDDVAGFDAEFFGISPREVLSIDPQQRLLLELGIEALDDAGIDPDSLKGSDSAVFDGASVMDYVSQHMLTPDAIGPYTNSGSALSNTANRLSYQLDLHGPSLKVDTACASALNAVHLACEHLRHDGAGSPSRPG